MSKIKLEDVLPNETFKYKGNEYRVAFVDNNGEYCCKSASPIRWLLPTDLVEVER